MRLADILSHYSDEALDRLASDKVDEVANLRLPRAVLIDEVALALTSLSYVAGALAPTRPPIPRLWPPEFQVRRFPPSGSSIESVSWSGPELDADRRRGQRVGPQQRVEARPAHAPSLAPSA